MNSKLNIKGKRLILRNITLNDARNFSKLGASTYSFGKINTLERAKKYIRKSLIRETEFELVIILKENNKLIGSVELCHLDWFNFKAGEITYRIKKEYRKKGYATEAARLLINYCFKKMKLRKIYADTRPDNKASQRVLEKLGFKLEGRIREKNFIKGKWIDELDYGLLKKEWKN